MTLRSKTASTIWTSIVLLALLTWLQAHCQVATNSVTAWDPSLIPEIMRQIAPFLPSPWDRVVTALASLVGVIIGFIIGHNHGKAVERSRRS